MRVGLKRVAVSRDVRDRRQDRGGKGMGLGVFKGYTSIWTSVSGLSGRRAEESVKGHGEEKTREKGREGTDPDLHEAWGCGERMGERIPRGVLASTDGEPGKSEKAQEGAMLDVLTLYSCHMDTDRIWMLDVCVLEGGYRATPFRPWSRVTAGSCTD